MGHVRHPVGQQRPAEPLVDRTPRVHRRARQREVDVRHISSRRCSATLLPTGTAALLSSLSGSA
jgi:hypothetical protein